MRGMRLNPKKCKEMVIDFLQYKPCELRTLVIGNAGTSNAPLETVDSYKLLGVHISKDLSWNTHCDYIVKKANKRLYEEMWSPLY
jgi:hypothetical protein